MKKICFAILFIAFSAAAFARITCSEKRSSGDFPLVDSGTAAGIYVDPRDFKSVRKTAELFADDIERVTGVRPKVEQSAIPRAGGAAVIIGTLGRNAFIDSLASSGRLDVSAIRGGWERYVVKTVANPAEGVPQALVIAGSDRRGASYGTFAVSEAAGVSPFYWWADIPIMKKRKLYLQPVDFTSAPPSVKYRGIFINDEGWGMKPWASMGLDRKIKNIGPETYAKVCELILRLRGNMLAPAMHPCTKAFYNVEGNKETADSFGIIITTSHCEPLLFNNATEWKKSSMGEWNYLENRSGILAALEARVAEAAAYENVYTVGMRGLHDAGMENTGGRDVEILESVMRDQREILERHVKAPSEKIPQIFVPYKETLEIYEKGLEVPDDVTIVWPDDNYGYIKRLNSPMESGRSGRAGVYYHISYLGAPHDYLWLCTTPPALMYGELKKAYEAGADRYWLLNVGDIKPMELSIKTFFDFAWNVGAWDYESMSLSQPKYLAEIFGARHFKTLKFIMDEYYRLAWSRKPEFMGWEREWDAPKYNDLADTEFSFENYNDARRRLDDYDKISAAAGKIYSGLPEEYRPAFFELVKFPVEASRQMNRKFLLAQLSRELANKGDFSGSNWAGLRAREAFEKINALNSEYNSMLDGKWNGMMTLPPGWCAKYQNMPEVAYREGTGEKAVDLRPSKSQDRLEGCCVLDLEKPVKVLSSGGRTVSVIEGIGYDWNSIQLGCPGEATGNPKDLAGACIEYEIPGTGADLILLHIYTVPFFELYKGAGTRFGVSVDGEPAVVVENNDDEFSGKWRDRVLRNGSLTVLKIPVSRDRKTHKISFICGDPGVMIQRVVVDWGGLKKTYVGPDARLAEK